MQCDEYHLVNIQIDSSYKFLFSIFFIIFIILMIVFIYTQFYETHNIYTKNAPSIYRIGAVKNDKIIDFIHLICK